MSQKLLELIRIDDRKINRRIQIWTLVAFVSIFAVTLLLGPFERPFDTIAFGASTAFLAWLVGFEAGRRRRRFAPLKSAGLRISQSMGRRGEQQVYKTYDMTGSVAEFTLDDVVNFALKALETIASGKSKIQEVRSAHREGWPGSWVFLTCDSQARPVFVDLKGIAETLSFVNGYIKDNERRARISAALSEISENAGEIWESAFGT